VAYPGLSQKSRCLRRFLWEGGYLHTQDIGNIDQQGYLRVTDRIKDVIKSGGEWVSSLDVENILSQHEGVSEAAVIGVADEKWGERPLGLVVPKEGREISQEEIRAHAREGVDAGAVSRYAVPKRIWFVEEIDKKALREKYGR
jgi:acyl-CoA synthetase (AMP-forming)/AMP-acid ligase II